MPEPSGAAYYARATAVLVKTGQTVATDPAKDRAYWDKMKNERIKSEMREMVSGILRAAEGAP